MTHGRRSRKNHVRAEEIAELLNADSLVKAWWTDRQAMSYKARTEANKSDDPCYLYVDDGGDDLMCVTVQRVPKPDDYEEMCG